MESNINWIYKNIICHYPIQLELSYLWLKCKTNVEIIWLRYPVIVLVLYLIQFLTSSGKYVINILIKKTKSIFLLNEIKFTQSRLGYGIFHINQSIHLLLSVQIYATLFETIYSYRSKQTSHKKIWRL